MTYPQVIRYLDSFIDYEKIPQYPYKQSLKLERIRGFLDAVARPQDSLKCIHIAGTKGKGSTSVFIAYILRVNGYKVGLYTSPHLFDFRERIRILNPISDKRKAKSEFEGMISEEDLSALVERLKPDIERFNARSNYGALSFFEVFTTLAFLHFKEKGTDFAVLETGLGGKLDATNVVNPLVCAITPISYEHRQMLGSTLTEIASEKAGIIKSHTLTGTGKSYPSIVITAPQEKEAMKIIRDRCRGQNATLYEAGKDIYFEALESNEGSQRFNVKGLFGDFKDLRITLMGRHQLSNATTALGVIAALNKFYQVHANVNAIRKGLYNTVWPGRFEIISKEPLVVLDGAQNEASARALKDAIKEKFPSKRIILILGVSQDKDIKGICQQLIPISDQVILTKAANPRAATAQYLKFEAKFFMSQDKIYLTDSVSEAVERARKTAEKDNLILITGSLFVVAEARPLF